MTEEIRERSPWVKAILIAVLLEVLSNAIYGLLRWLLDWLKFLEIFTIAIVMEVIALTILILIVPSNFRYKRLAMGLTLILIVITVVIWMTIGKGNLEIVMRWDFEGDTVQGWGIYDEKKGEVVPSPDVVTSPVVTSPEDAKEKYSLKVSNINLEAPPKPSEAPKPNAHKKWLAVRYKSDLTNAKVTALVYVPVDAEEFRYADAKLFLFDSKYKWHESGSRGRGVELVPGEWVELSWDLRRHRTFWWSSPWRKILGIQVYVEGIRKGAYGGPIYIDNVKVYKHAS